jgi:hypothetical protein
MERSCLHCALARALRAESEAYRATGLTLSFTRSDPVWLPAPGMRLYRAVRRLLQMARVRADGGGVKLAVVDLPGKSHVEVTATVPVGRGTRVLALSLPRHAPGTLARGFAETLDALGC